MVELLDKNKSILIGLLSAGIRNKPFVVEGSASIDLHELFVKAAEHNVSPLIYRPLAENRIKLGIPEKLLEKLRIDILKEGMKQEHDYIAIGFILRRFAASGIQVIPLKGLVFRALYPDPGLRIMGDYDLLLKPYDMDKAGKILDEEGYVKSLDVDKHVTYSHITLPMLELHRAMVPADQFENYEAFEVQAWKNAKPLTVSGAQVLSLDPVDTEVYQVMHLASHMIGNGFGLRQLCDFVLFTEAYGSVVDWKEFYSRTSTLQLQVFVIALFQLCHLLFDLDIPEECRQFGEPDIELMKSFAEDIFSGGIFGKSTNERVTANRLIYYSEGKAKESFTGSLLLYLKLFFPGADRLDVRYQYAKKCRLFLPVAWIHRFLYSITRRDIDFYEKTAVFASSEPASIFASRSKMLHELGLLD
ncbi:MAG TPA: nucleotidyltransferase family protein [Clostridia bacterium]|nr:nucleotidyltransferase family protein [Clostridia bacterium]